MSSRIPLPSAYQQHDLFRHPDRRAAQLRPRAPRHPLAEYAHQPNLGGRPGLRRRAGARIKQRTVQGGTTTTTYYLLGGQEEVQIVSGGATTITKNYPTGAGTHLPQPIKVGTAIAYLATDGLDTVSEAVDSAGNVTAQQLYLPYGGSRYTSGTMPTSKG